MEPSRTDMELTPPDIVLLGPEWPERPCGRSSSKEGDDVIAIDAWPIPRLYQRPGMKP
jgi:hypothetical protein